MYLISSFWWHGDVRLHDISWRGTELFHPQCYRIKVQNVSFIKMYLKISSPKLSTCYPGDNNIDNKWFYSVRYVWALVDGCDNKDTSMKIITTGIWITNTWNSSNRRIPKRKTPGMPLQSMLKRSVFTQDSCHDANYVVTGGFMVVISDNKVGIMKSLGVMAIIE